EYVMKNRDLRPRRTALFCRLIFAAGAILMIPGAGLTLQAPPGAQQKETGRTGSLQLAAADVTVTLTGVVRDKSTGKPVAEIQIDTDVPSYPLVKTDATGRFTLANLPAKAQYQLLATCASGAPYLISSRVVEAPKAGRPQSADLELVRGIPFRV